MLLARPEKRGSREVAVVQFEIVVALRLPVRSSLKVDSIWTNFL